MSAESTARWNAIPMERTAETSGSLKRPRDDDQDHDDESDDEMALVSRSPSPVDDMAVDPDDISKYDEYLRSAPREVITVDTRLNSTNKGFAMLAKLGWSEGTPLGLSTDGRVDPIPLPMKSDSTGIGKISQDVEMIETTVQQRRGLDSERQQKETEEQRQAREDAVSRQAVVQSEISDVLKPFFCELCDKQFKNVAQYDEHTNSYAHHHKARAKDMQAMARLQNQDEYEARKEKERKREEKELRKIAKANGIKVAKPTVSLPLPASTSASSGTSGWGKVASPPPPPPPSASGWSSVGSTSAPPPPPPSQPAPAPPGGEIGWAKPSAGGWSTIAPADSVVPPPPRPTTIPDVVPPVIVPATPSEVPAPPEARPSRANNSRMGWQSFQKNKRR